MTDFGTSILDQAKKEEAVIQVGESVAFCVRIVSDDPNDVSDTVARISFPEASESQVIFRPAETLEHDGTDNSVYTGRYEKFTRPGEHIITFQAEHKEEECPPSDLITMTVKCVVKGDINRNDKIDLPDAVMALKAAADPDSVEIENLSEIEVNGDGEIGLEELIYILQILTNSKPKEFSDGIRGDISGNRKVDLTDAIMALKAAADPDFAEQLQPAYAESGADVNGDGNIGLAELVFILKTLTQN